MNIGISVLPTLGIAWREKMKWYYVPYRSLKPYRVHGVELVVHAQQTATREEIGEIAYPLKATVLMGNNLDS